MMPSGGDPGRPAGGGLDTSSVRARWAETALIWVGVALAGGAFWLSAADPLFGGPDAAQACLTMFAFVVAVGAAATAAIWLWPAVWDRWFRRLPPEGGGRLDAAKMLTAALFWVLAIALIVFTVEARWHPVTVGAAAGCLLLGRMAVEFWLHHRLGRRP